VHYKQVIANLLLLNYRHNYFKISRQLYVKKLNILIIQFFTINELKTSLHKVFTGKFTFCINEFSQKGEKRKGKEGRISFSIIHSFKLYIAWEIVAMLTKYVIDLTYKKVFFHIYFF